jgi:hypothetical protein
MLTAAVGYRRGVVSHREELIKIREGTALSVHSLVNPGPMTCGLAEIQTKQNKITTQSLYLYFKVQTRQKSGPKMGKCNDSRHSILGIQAKW